MFVYRITDIKNKKYYYGSKIAKNSNFNQMGKTYFSSSKNKEFIIDQKDNPENFKYKLVKYFKTAEDTIKYESKLHFKFNVKSNNKFYNMSNQTTDGVKFFNGKITCPFCEQNVNLGNYERWHGENCRVLDESKTFFDRMHYFPYMKLLRNKETLKLEWINTKFFLYDDSLYTTDLKNQRTKIKTEEGYITINTSELTNDCILINSKEWVILNKNNEIVHRNYSIKKLSYIIKYMTLLYSTNSTKSSVTFLHERAQLNRAVSEDLLKFEGWKMMTIEEYNDKEYDIYDKNRINKILSGRNNYKFVIYDANNFIIDNIPSIIFDKIYNLKIPFRHLNNKVVKFNKEHSSYKDMIAKGYTKFEGYKSETVDLTTSDISIIEKVLGIEI